MSTVVRRPLWRSFTQRFVRNAVAHVNAGGHAMLWRRARPSATAWMLLPCEPDGSVPELAFWSMLALSRQRFEVVRRGPARGLAIMRIPRMFELAVDEWCERDSVWQGSVRRVRLDCAACGACCRDNRVIVDAGDLVRWKRAGRDDLRSATYTRRSKGDLLLRAQKTPERPCVHLDAENRCGIYTLRPDNCSSFPVGSETCLEARVVELGMIDGAKAPRSDRRVWPRV